MVDCEGHDFAACRQALGELYGARETLIRAARNLTRFSKNLIFFVHRVHNIDGGAGAGGDTGAELRTHFANVAASAAVIHRRCDADVQVMVQFKGSYGGAFEELIEAIVFGSFMFRDFFMSYNEVLQFIKLLILSAAEDRAAVGDYLVDVFLGTATEKKFDVDEISILYISQTAYILGLADVTGELMRWVILSLGEKEDLVKSVLETKRRKLDGAAKGEKETRILGHLRVIETGLKDVLSTQGEDIARGNLKRKVQVLLASVEKVQLSILSRRIREMEVLEY